MLRMIKKFLNRFKRMYRIKMRLPVLLYMETHLVDHCNLSCIGCTHYSHLSEEFYTNVNEFERNLKALSKRLRFYRIRLLGGEPLLHPEIIKFMQITRKYFPRTKLFICTNGILLPTMNEEFWQACREYDFAINLSSYPPTEDKIPKYIKLLESNGVKAGWIHPGEKMWMFHNQFGNSNKQIAKRLCPATHFRLLVMKNGRLYTCPKTAYINIYNKYFKTQIPQDKGIDIYKKSGKKIVEYISKPIETCRYCAYQANYKKWKISKGDISEWNVKDTKEDLDLLQKEAINNIKKMIRKQKIPSSIQPKIL